MTLGGRSRIFYIFAIPTTVIEKMLRTPRCNTDGSFIISVQKHGSKMYFVELFLLCSTSLGDQFKPLGSTHIPLVQDLGKSMGKSIFFLFTEKAKALYSTGTGRVVGSASFNEGGGVISCI